MLAFFDDILIYSSFWTEHLQHVCTVLDVLREHHLHVKHLMCMFASPLVQYLGHVISVDSVAMDSAKVDTVTSWPQPRLARGLRGFLVLAGYYRRFIMVFDVIVAPLTLLLKEGFKWSEEATTTFTALKTALSATLVLHLPDFDKEFVVDCDSSKSGLSAVLHQGAGPLAFFSRPFIAHHMMVVVYECELIGLVQVVRHWRPYLWGRAFVVCTDHYALKFMLNQ